MGMRVGRRGRDRARWLVPPRLRTEAGEGEERRATWLELFFDLVFVVAITQLAHELVLDHSTAGFLRFGGLFVPVYVAWQGYMAYADRFDTDDLAFRLAYFAAMLAIAAMAILIDDVGHGLRSSGFAVAYVVLRSIMLALYGRAWRSVPQARPLIRFYAPGYGIGVAIWLASLAVDAPLRYVMWGIALVLDLSLPPLSPRMVRPRVPTSGSHLPERWALFTMIVFGESIVAVALATSGTDWRLESAAAAVLGFTAVAGTWWLYFDRQASVVLRSSTRIAVIYSYAHLPLLMGLAATSAGLRLLIERAGEDHLGPGPSVAFVGGIVVFLLSLVATRSVTVTGPRRVGISLKLGTAAILLVLFATEAAFSPVALAGAVAFVLSAMVFAERTLFPPSEPHS
ncbi:MAG TPA: low temperature requirement protein A [Actinomycetota bacterium]|jgi:low temperature requirement protein LtrA|nr:low temperature requirement protein A [Actinomycetota bacterium]